MQRIEGDDAVAHCRDLADHEHAVLVLVGFGHGDDLSRGIAVQAFRGHAHAAHVHVFETVAQFVCADTFAQQFLARIAEFTEERRVDAARRMPGPGLEVDGLVAGNRGITEALDHGTAVDDFLGEQIGRAHDAADLHAACRQRRRQGSEHRAGSGVVNAAGKQDVVAGFGARLHVGQQHLDHLLPQREAGQRADVSTAFAAFEHEALGTLLDVHPQQRRGWCVDVGRNAFLLEMCGLIGTATGDQCVSRLALPDRGDLLLAQAVRHETEQSDTPGQHAAIGLGHARLGLLEHLQDLRAAIQRQRQERQGAIPRHLVGELRGIRYPGHRTLGNRERGAVRLRERAARRHETGGDR